MYIVIWFLNIFEMCNEKIVFLMNGIGEFGCLYVIKWKNK